MAIVNAINPASKKVHHSIFMLKAKSCSHLYIAYQPTGTAIINANKTSCIKSLDSKVVIFTILAPKTFLMPISLTRCETENEIKPNNPIQAIKMVSNDMYWNNEFIFCSPVYKFEILSSKNL